MDEKFHLSSLNGTTRETQVRLISTFIFPNSLRTASPVRNKPLVEVSQEVYFSEHKNNGPISIYQSHTWLLGLRGNRTKKCKVCKLIVFVRKKSTLQDTNKTPRESKTERGCRRWRLFRHYYDSLERLCLVPVRGFPRISWSIHFGRECETTWPEKHWPRGTMRPRD